MSVTLLTGDCREVMATMDAASVDAVVTDPPYDLTSGKRGGSGEKSLNLAHPAGRSRITTGGGFMGKVWDGTGVAFDPETWRAVFRVLKPGGRLLAFGGTRTHHRMVCAIEDAGFVVEDEIMWLHGQGFPKHKSKLKPGHEPICVAWKPDKRATVLNIDACRIATTEDERVEMRKHSESFAGKRWGDTHFNYGYPDSMPIKTVSEPSALGRWPANVVLSHTEDCREVGTRRVKGSNGIRGRGGSVYGGGKGYTADFSELGQQVGYADPDGYETVSAWDCSPDCPILLLDAQSGERPSTGNYPSKGGCKSEGWGNIGTKQGPLYADTGGASRFYYVAKASRSERGPGNDHPTVKPIALMRWLVRLVCPPGGTVLDPFLGSGTTLVACELEGLHGIGIEQSEEYVEIARRRIAAATPKIDPNKPRQLSLEGASS